MLLLRRSRSLPHVLKRSREPQKKRIGRVKIQPVLPILLSLRHVALAFPYSAALTHVHVTLLCHAKSMSLRALVDSDAADNFVSAEVCQQLGVKPFFLKSPLEL